jgi:3-oxoacyl-[acyl-carrier protein] reductase
VASWDIKDAEPEAGGIFQKVDVSNAASVESAIEETVRALGPLHVLINNAGILRDGQIVKVKEGAVASLMSGEQFDAVIAVNLRGVFVVTRAAAARMILAGAGGVILNASSVVGIYGNFGQTNYVASKAGVIGMTRVWAREFGRYNIRVNAVAPGNIDTDMMKAVPEKARESLRAHTPLGRMGQPDDIASAYLWLASDAASFITGAVLSVDGGIVTGT